MIKDKRRKKDPRFDWHTIFIRNSGGLSSKRICGVLGWLICLGLLVTGFVIEREVPQYGELIAIISASLLGIDSVTGIWSKSINS